MDDLADLHRLRGLISPHREASDLAAVPVQLFKDGDGARDQG